MSLDLAARGLGDTFDGNHLCDLKPRVLIDETCDLGRQRQELGKLAPMQYECHECVGLCAAAADTGNHDLPQVKSCGALRNGLQIMRVVILTVDENDLLRAPRNIELAGDDEPKIAGAQPAIGGQSGSVCCRVLVITLCNARATDVDVANLLLG